VNRRLTRIQEQVLEYLRRVIEENGISPTLGEIAAGFGKSTGSIQTALKGLQAKGCVEIVPKKSRGIRLLGPGDAERRLLARVRLALAPALEEGVGLATVFRVAQEELPPALGMETAALWIRDESLRRFVGAADLALDPPKGFDFPPEIPMRIRSEPVFVPDRGRSSESPISVLLDPRVRSFVTVPLRTGALAVASSRPVDASAEEVRGAAVEISELLEPALHGATAQLRVREDLRLHRILLDLVRQVGREETPLFLRRVFEHVASLLPVDAAWIGRRRIDGKWEALLETDLDDRDRRVFFPAPRVMEQDQARIFEGGGPYVLVHRTGEEASRAATRRFTPAGNPRRRSASLLFVPIGEAVPVTGAISVQSYRWNAYRHADAERLLTIARYVELALRWPR